VYVPTRANWLFGCLAFVYMSALMSLPNAGVQFVLFCPLMSDSLSNNWSSFDLHPCFTNIVLCSELDHIQQATISHVACMVTSFWWLRMACTLDEERSAACVKCRATLCVILLSYLGLKTRRKRKGPFWGHWVVYFRILDIACGAPHCTIFMLYTSR